MRGERQLESGLVLYYRGGRTVIHSILLRERLDDSFWVCDSMFITDGGRVSVKSGVIYETKYLLSLPEQP